MEFPDAAAKVVGERFHRGSRSNLNAGVDRWIKGSDLRCIGLNDKEEELTSFIDSHDGDWFDEKKFTVKLPIEIEVFILIDEKTGEIADSEFR